MVWLIKATVLTEKQKNLKKETQHLHVRDHLVVSSLKHQAALATTDKKDI